MLSRLFLLSLLLCLGSGAHAAINVLDREYGVVGNGIADDTAGLRRALAKAKATRQKVVLPAPTRYYKISDELVIDFTGLVIEGEGFAMESTTKIVQTKTNKNAFRIAIPSNLNSNHYIVFRNFIIQGPGADISSGDGLNIVPPAGKFTDQIYLENMQIAGFRNGLQADHWSNSTLSNVIFDSNYNSFVAGGNCNAINLNGCWLGSNRNTCVILTGTGSFNFRGCEMGNSPRLMLMRMNSAAWFENVTVESILGPAPDGSQVHAAIQMDANAVFTATNFKINNGGGSLLPAIRCDRGIVNLMDVRMSGFLDPVVLDRTVPTNASVLSSNPTSPNRPKVRTWWNDAFDELTWVYSESRAAIYWDRVPAPSEMYRGVELDVFRAEWDIGREDYKIKCLRQADGSYAWVMSD